MRKLALVAGLLLLLEIPAQAQDLGQSQAIHGDKDIYFQTIPQPNVMLYVDNSNSMTLNAYSGGYLPNFQYYLGYYNLFGTYSALTGDICFLFSLATPSVDETSQCLTFGGGTSVDGSFLNWLSASRMDVLKTVISGWSDDNWFLQEALIPSYFRHVRFGLSTFTGIPDPADFWSGLFQQGADQGGVVRAAFSCDVDSSNCNNARTELLDVDPNNMTTYSPIGEMMLEGYNYMVGNSSFFTYFNFFRYCEDLFFGGDAWDYNVYPCVNTVNSSGVSYSGFFYADPRKQDTNDGFTCTRRSSGILITDGEPTADGFLTCSTCDALSCAFDATESYDRFTVADSWTAGTESDSDDLAGPLGRNQCYDAGIPQDHCPNTIYTCTTNDTAAADVAEHAYDTNGITTHVIGITDTLSVAARAFVKGVADESGGNAVFLPLEVGSTLDTVIEPRQTRFALPHIIDKIFSNLFSNLTGTFTPDVTPQRFAPATIPPSSDGVTSGDKLFQTQFFVDGRGRWRGNILKCDVNSDFFCTDATDLFKSQAGGCASGSGVNCQMKRFLGAGGTRYMMADADGISTFSGFALPWGLSSVPSTSTMSISTSELTPVTEWFVGYDSFDEDFDGSTNPSNGITSETRDYVYQAFTHSSPLHFEYDGGTSYIAASSNAGAVHIFDSTTGVEEYSFVFGNTFGDVPTLRYGEHQNFNTGKVILAHDDCDDDGKIDGTSTSTCTGGVEERAFLIATQGVAGSWTELSGCSSSGCGNCIYIYNIGGDDLPTSLLSLIVDGLHFKICPAMLSGLLSVDKNFTQMGLVTSAFPFKFGDDLYMAFGGGYNPDFDDDSLAAFSLATFPSFSYSGAAFWIVDLQTKNSLNVLNLVKHKFAFLSSHSSTGVAHTAMRYPIVGQIAGTNTLGFGDSTDRLYVGDLAGQLWRVDLTQDPPEMKVVYAAPTPSNAKNMASIWERPDIVPQFVGARKTRVLVFATGNRHRAIDTNQELGSDVHNQIVAVIDPFDAQQASAAPLDNSDLINATTTLQDDTFNILGGNFGWYRTIGGQASASRRGEKAWGTPIVLGGTAFVPTFVPDQDEGDYCSAGPGTAWLYELNLRNASEPNLDRVTTQSPPAATSLGTGAPVGPIIQVSASGDITAVYGTSTGAAATSSQTKSLGKSLMCMSGWTEELLE